jgi:hypothetical protein
LLNDQWVTDEIKEEFNFLEANENVNLNCRNLWDTTKAVLREKFIAMSAYIKRTERSLINDQMLCLKLLEKQVQAKSKSWFFEKINKIDRPLANLTKMKRDIKSEMQKGR